MTAALPLPRIVERASDDIYMRVMAELRAQARHHGVSVAELVVDLHERLEDLLASVDDERLIQLVYARYTVRRDGDESMATIAREARAALIAAAEPRRTLTDPNMGG